LRFENILTLWLTGMQSMFTSLSNLPVKPEKYVEVLIELVNWGKVEHLESITDERIIEWFCEKFKNLSINRHIHEDMSTSELNEA
jgi:hypothetical protein